MATDNHYKTKLKSFNLATFQPKRARRRSCNVGVYGESCSPAGTTTEMEDCLDLPYCKVMNRK